MKVWISYLHRHDEYVKEKNYTLRKVPLTAKFLPIYLFNIMPNIFFLKTFLLGPMEQTIEKCMLKYELRPLQK